MPYWYHADTTRNEKPVTFKNQSGCELLIPHKDWSGDSQERENYAEIERWAKRLQDCFAACTCSVVQRTFTKSQPDSAISAIASTSFTSSTLCGTPSTSHLIVATLTAMWQGNVTGTRDVQWFINGESDSSHGLTVPGCSAWDGQQRMTVTKILPAHTNTLSPEYFVQIWQNSGVNLNINLLVHEYQPCCDCDWPVGC